MSIALSTLLVVVALIPSIAFLNSYYAGKFPRQLSGMSPLTELALYFFWALVIDGFAMWSTGFKLNPQIFQLSLGVLEGVDKDDAIADLVASFEGRGWWHLFQSYLLIVGAAAVSGAVTRRLVWALRLDSWIPLLRLHAEWYYVYLGRVPGNPWQVIPFADVLVEHPGTSGTRLFAGIVAGFDHSKDGGMEQLYLEAAQRHRMKDSGGTELVDIPGDALAIQGRTILSINVRYFELLPPKGAIQRLWFHLNGFLEALVRE